VYKEDRAQNTTQEEHPITPFSMLQRFLVCMLASKQKENTLMGLGLVGLAIL